VETLILRIWFPDRPGALGHIASRIGAAGGDLIGIDILERENGQVIDELTVSLPDRDGLDLLLNEVGQVDGARVEEARWVTTTLHDPRLDALDAAAVLVAEQTRHGLVDRYCERIGTDFDADWAAVLEAPQLRVLASSGAVPNPRWLVAFVNGAGSVSTFPPQGLTECDVALVPVRGTRLLVLASRPARPLRERERRQIESLGRIVQLRWQQLDPSLVAGQLDDPSPVVSH